MKNSASCEAWFKHNGLYKSATKAPVLYFGTSHEDR